MNNQQDASGLTGETVERIDLWRATYPMWQQLIKQADDYILNCVSDHPIAEGTLYRCNHTDLKVERVLEKRKARGMHSKPTVFYSLLCSEG